MILAGDIGGTKTRLGLFEPAGTRPVVARTYPTSGFERPADIVEEFLAALGVRPPVASFGVAAAIQGRYATSAKLPWAVDADELERQLGVNEIRLVNDVQANARAISVLDESDLAVLNPGAADATGTRAVVSAGTGLGEAALWWDGTSHRPSPSEGGSSSFAPRSELEIQLYRHLAAKRGRVNVGHLLCGSGLRQIYSFLDGGAVPPRAPAITAAAMADPDSLESAALDLFVSIYGARAGDVALTYGATGGVYLGGGIAPKILPRLLEGRFLRAFLDKGSLTWYLRRMPVRVVLNADAALIGAALYAQDGPARAYPLAA
jgi:glucokinase